MGKFNKFNRGDRGGRGGFSAQGRPPSGWGGRSDGPKQMFPAVCGKCGEDCQVPFRPSGDRPVFCSNCFKEQGGGNDRPRFAPKRFDGGNRDSAPRVSAPDYSAQFASLNAKMDKILSMLTPVKVEKVEKEEVKKEKKVAKKAKSKKK